MECPNCGVHIDISDTDNIPRLSPQQKLVARLIRDGLTNNDIAEQMNLSVRTIKAMVHQCLLKLRVRNRIELAVILTAPLNSPLRLGIESRAWQDADIEEGSSESS